MIPPVPPLAIGFDVIVSIAVLATGVIGWVVQLIQQNRQAPPRGGLNGGANRPNRQAAGEDRLRDEIDSFLQEVSGQKPRQRPRREGGPVDPFEEPARRRTPREDVPDFLRGERPPPRDRPRRPVPQAEPDRPVRRLTEAAESPAAARERQQRAEQRKRDQRQRKKSLRDRHLDRLPKSGVGSELAKHVDRYMRVKQSDLAREHVLVRGRLEARERELAELKRKLADPNDATRLKGDSVFGTTAGGAARIGELLRDPGTVRDAIVINELLAKPLALRDAAGRKGAAQPSPVAAATGGGITGAAGA